MTRASSHYEKEEENNERYVIKMMLVMVQVYWNVIKIPQNNVNKDGKSQTKKSSKNITKKYCSSKEKYIKQLPTIVIT